MWNNIPLLNVLKFCQLYTEGIHKIEDQNITQEETSCQLLPSGVESFLFWLWKWLMFLQFFLVNCWALFVIFIIGVNIILFVIGDVKYLGIWNVKYKIGIDTFVDIFVTHMFHGLQKHVSQTPLWIDNDLHGVCLGSSGLIEPCLTSVKPEPCFWWLHWGLFGKW